MRISVKGGTADHGRASLCESCRSSTIVRGARLGEEIVECARLSFENARVPFPVVSCSDYSDRSRPSLREMEEIAWVLKSDPRRGQVGFVHSSLLPEEERHVLKAD
jgi:hypothetical protein